MIKSKARVFVFLIVIFAWMVISPVAFFGKFNQVYEKNSPDGSYKVIAYSVMPTTPVSIFQSLLSGDIFLVLYDSRGNYIGQSSPFHFSDLEGIFGDKLFFPEGKGGDDSFSINGVDDYVIGYNIPVSKKRWWSWIIYFLH